MLRCDRLVLCLALSTQAGRKTLDNSTSILKERIVRTTSAAKEGVVRRKQITEHTGLEKNAIDWRAGVASSVPDEPSFRIS